MSFSPVRRVLAVALTLAVGWGLLAFAPASVGGVAFAADAPGVQLGLTGPAKVVPTGAIALRATVAGWADPATAPAVVFEAHRGGAWVEVGRAKADASGVAALKQQAGRTVGTVKYRSRVEVPPAPQPEPEPGAEPVPPAEPVVVISNEVVVTIAKAKAVLGLKAPKSVVDERSATLEITGSSLVDTVSVTVESKTGSRWSRVGTVKVSPGKPGKLSARPRVNTSYRARSSESVTTLAAMSPTRAIKNLPSGVVVRLPAGAPKPTIKLPRQARAKGSGANPKIKKIPSRVWSQMSGVSWRPGCPVGRSGLRYLKINYWGYDGYRYRGELVAATTAIDNMSRALTTMYRKKLPIRSMYLVDRFGYSATLRGANDYKSMAAGNTSAFNCRSVVGRPGVRSPHSSGRSLDLNPWENPFRSAKGLVPNTWWHTRSHSKVAWRTSSHPVVKLMAKQGLRWTYRTGDSHHFDVRR